MSPEVVVSISDFVLGALAGALAWRVLQRPTEMPRTRRWFAIVLGAIAVGSFLGGISHGFFPSESSPAGGILWRATLMSIGPAAIGLWMLASILLFRPAAVERARAMALITLAVYLGVVLFEYQSYRVALAMYLPAAVLLMIGFAVHLRGRSEGNFALSGLIAMGITLVAGLLQYLHVGIHPVYFNHNALYHLFQAVAVFFLYRAATKWLDPRTSSFGSLKASPLVAKIG